MKTVITALSLLILSGCANMQSSLSPELRYGQLYALEDALSSASRHCSDNESVFTASYWAANTVGNIADYSQYLKAGSPQHAKSKELVTQLYLLHSVAVNQLSHCRQFAIAGETTRELLALLNAQSER